MRTASIIVVLMLPLSAVAAGPEVRCIDPDKATGTSRAVIVGRTALAHTAQFLPLDAEGRVVGKGKATDQVDKAFDNLAVALKALRAGKEPLDRVVKINVYVARAGVRAEVEGAFRGNFRGPVQPAVSYVVTPLPHPDALVAFDAVVAADDGADRVKLVSVGDVHPVKGGSHLAVLPPGPRVYVAGQAEKGAGLAEATRKTLETLRATLKFLELTDADVVQLKAFLMPMTKVDEARKEIVKFYGKAKVPPVVFVEWKSSAAAPIEIELIAAARKAKEKPAEAVEYLTPPGMTASPVFSRVARVHHDTTIYVSGLYGPAGKSGAEQVLAVFKDLEGLLKKSGSNLRHLAKATYYVSTDDASGKLNELRPRFYDRNRPPAASKAMVAGVGRDGCGLTLDMIAVPAP